MKTVAILGPTASGKTDIALSLARRHRCAILSLDSLAIYREIDIASAKPTPEERKGIPHFGIDVLTPDTPFNVTDFITIYRHAADFCHQNEYDLIIVGGTGFYLKTLMDGISELPEIDPAVKAAVARHLARLSEAYEHLRRLDPAYAARIESSDRYRIEKGLQLYYQTGTVPTDYFRLHPPQPLLENLSLFEIAMPRETLWRRIERRTRRMIENGLVDEVAALEKKYGRQPHPMKAIGIVEVLDYFDGRIDLAQMQEHIVIHTRQLAKRQGTFNRTQFPPHPTLPPEEVESAASEILQR